MGEEKRLTASVAAGIKDGIESQRFAFIASRVRKLNAGEETAAVTVKMGLKEETQNSHSALFLESHAVD